MQLNLQDTTHTAKYSVLVAANKGRGAQQQTNAAESVNRPLFRRRKGLLCLLCPQCTVFFDSEILEGRVICFLHRKLPNKWVKTYWTPGSPSWLGLFFVRFFQEPSILVTLYEDDIHLFPKWKKQLLWYYGFFGNLYRMYCTNKKGTDVKKPKGAHMQYICRRLHKFWSITPTANVNVSQKH